MIQDYIHDNVRLTTQPFDVKRQDDPMIEALNRLGMADVLMFSSDYPHWDTDVPALVRNLMPPHWRSKVMYENAAQLYQIRLPVPA